MKKSFLHKVLIVSFIFGSCFADSVQIKGSDTLVNLVQKLSEVYMKKHPDANISVSGGGSGTGIAALINGKTDIADASRLMKDKELAKCKSKGMDVRQVVIAVDALSIIVNDSNPITSLSMEQIAAIYKGDVTNWADVGGPNKIITLYGRQPSSGTFDFIREHVLNGEYSDKMNQMNGNAQIVEAVMHDEGGIGYVGVAYATKGGTKPLNGLKILKVSATNGGITYSPLDENMIYSGKYPIVRGLNQYLSGKPKGLVKTFIQFELSDEGQKIVADEGFYPLKGDFLKKNEKLFDTKVKFF
ncbi:MAG: PstS family phosphate ABC transporter substrate-binding protein [Candidatus Margulisbacteria bacterium]|nr:PstS family phosphate ABC transporter substrate-binding protein [Candidatus Margulisiibacteriota bacterium]